MNSCPASTVNFIWFTDDKLLKFYTIAATKTPKTITFTHLWGQLDFYTFQQDSEPAHTACKMVEFLYRKMLDFVPSCCLGRIRWTFFISEPDKVYHRSRVATDSTSWDRQACTHDTLWHQCYITTSKEYLTNSHILLKYFELIFIQLQLVKISCKLITIWLSYKRNKKGAFLLKHCVYLTMA